ncbi:ATP-binding protein [Aliamphritea spongicola]|uniref:ATP-binding protein n=1 Tax=Aliamphritea spongicola TaxID=707589 RepID=UPI00196B92AB|nr:ATP-binding protein [Aliamphritea spongicola]MBN3564861.1 response regulator [Aliamphritea spongicola]
MHALPDLIRQLLRYPKDHPLGYRIMQYVSACSFVFILLSTAVQLTLDYQREFRALNQQLEVIRDSYLASLAKSLWDIDQAQIELQLQGIENLPDISELELRLPTTAAQDPLPEPHKNMQRFELIHTTASGQQRNLGQLDVHIDIQGIYNRIYAKGFTILLNQTLLVLLIVLVILIIFHRQITRHLEAMATYSRDIGAGQLEDSLRLNRHKPQHRDELDQLVSALNDMRQAIQQDRQRRDQEQQELRYNRDQLQTMVEQRTESLRRAKEAAEEANDAKTRFLATISHEIRTPMNGMLGMIQLLENTPLSNSQHKQVQVLHDATDALLETFNQVLEYGRLIEGAHQVEQKPFALQAMLENLISLFEPGARDKGLKIELHYPPSLAPAYFAAHSSLRQILNNLLANAIKFTHEGEITLTVSQLTATAESHTLRFSIRDTGVGIPQPLQEKIFERFTQADESITRRFGGTGLGLAICKELALQLNADIGLQSEAGQGSCFWLEVKLPVCDSHLTASNPELTSDISAPPGSQPELNILLVEDVQINQDVVLGLLAPFNHRISIASDGEQALTLCKQQSFDLILMDMHLPGRSGLEISKLIRNNPEFRHQSTQIIALTASVRQEDLHTYRTLGIDTVIAKPVDRNQLFSAISHSADDSANLSNPVESPEFADPLPVLDNSLISMHEEMLGPEKVQKLMAGFVNSCDELWPAIRQSLTENDLSNAEQLLHKLAGACDTLGFRAAGTLLRHTEQQLADAKIPDLPTLLQQLHSAIEASRKIASHWPEQQRNQD